MTAAAEAATEASDEIALAVTAVTSARLRLLRLQPRWNSRKQQRTLSPVREDAVIIEDALYIYIYKVDLCDRSRLRCRRGNRKSLGFYSALGAACGPGVAIADLVAY